MLIKISLLSGDLLQILPQLAHLQKALIPADKHERVLFRSYLEEQSLVHFVLMIGAFFHMNGKYLTSQITVDVMVKYQIIAESRTIKDQLI